MARRDPAVYVDLIQCHGIDEGVRCRSLATVHVRAAGTRYDDNYVCETHVGDNDEIIARFPADPTEETHTNG